MSEREIDIKIKRLGYTPFKVKKEKPSFYKLEDGSILKVLSIVNAIILNEKKPNAISVDAQNVVSAFVPKKLHGEPVTKPVSIPEASKKLDIEDLEFDVIVEPFNEYRVAGKYTLKLKTILNQVNRSKLLNNIGQPIYLINTTLSPKFKRR